tara:strand:+ start:91 stop:243 length:153 start_codon:yes stop_codon:yes gene_type:complete
MLGDIVGRGAFLGGDFFYAITDRAKVVYGGLESFPSVGVHCGFLSSGSYR